MDTTNGNVILFGKVVTNLPRVPVSAPWLKAACEELALALRPQ